jgi:hypothetical protein
LVDKPLVVSVGSISHRQVLRLHEADEQLQVYTEAFDERNAKLAKETSGKQRKAQKSMSAQQGAPVQQIVTPQDMNTQIAAAMAQAQEQLANDPNVTPEMRAQMEAIMSQMGQVTGRQSTAPLSAPAVQSQVAAVQGSSGGKGVSENVLKVDSGMRGLIEYENRDGRLITLLIFDRKTGRELLKKDYPDGVIYEYVDFSRFMLPLEQIGVVYKEVAGMILEDLTPVISQ